MPVAFLQTGRRYAGHRCWIVTPASPTAQARLPPGSASPRRAGASRPHTRTGIAGHRKNEPLLGIAPLGHDPESAPLAWPLIDATRSWVTDCLGQERVTQVGCGDGEGAGDERANLERAPTWRERGDHAA